jgi:hypothetical protein
MRYMLLIYTREDARARRSQEEMLQVMNGHLAMMQEARSKGVLEAGEPLENTSAARTVRLQNGKHVTTDGPFAETKEQLAGYYILNVKDQEEAVAWAAKIPTTCGGLEGCVEVRAIRAVPTSEKELQLMMDAPARNG